MNYRVLIWAPDERQLTFRDHDMCRYTSEWQNPTHCAKMGDQPPKQDNSIHVTLTPRHILTIRIAHTLNFPFSLSLSHTHWSTKHLCFDLHKLNIPVVSFHSNQFFPTWLFIQHDKLSPNSVKAKQPSYHVHSWLCDSRIQEELIWGLQLGPPFPVQFDNGYSLLKVQLDWCPKYLTPVAGSGCWQQVETQLGLPTRASPCVLCTLKLEVFLILEAGFWGSQRSQETHSRSCMPPHAASHSTTSVHSVGSKSEGQQKSREGNRPHPSMGEELWPLLISHIPYE